MPIYKYFCQVCHNYFEFFKLKSTSTLFCSYCNNSNEKLLLKIPMPATVFFKGDGWTTMNYSESIDPETIKGVKKVDYDKLSKNDKILYKNCKKRCKCKE